MRERVTVVTLSVIQSVSLSVFHSGEGAVFGVETYISIHSRSRFKSFKCSTFLKIEAILEKKRVELRPLLTAVMYVGTAQSLNGLARDLLASEPFTKAVICVVPELVYSLRLVAGLQTAFLSRK